MFLKDKNDPSVGLEFSLQHRGPSRRPKGVFWIRFELDADSDAAIKLNAAADPDLSFDICASHRKKFHIFSPSFHIIKISIFFI